MKIKNLLTIIFAVLLINSVGLSQQSLKPNEARKISLQPEETKAFILNLKKGDFAEIIIVAEDAYNFRYKILAPSGDNLLDYAVVMEDAFPFVALEDGAYQVEITLNKNEEKTGARDVAVSYQNKFALPKNMRIKASRKVNGYDAKIYEAIGEDDDAYLIIEKAGRLKFISKATKNVGGLSFADTLEKGVSKSEQVSANLFRATPDKTGDGTPDIALSYYSGGAHCCFSMYFYELGDDVKPVDSLQMGNADLAAVGKSPNGGLKLMSGDDTFAYWNTSFAGSPIPQIILDFRDGKFQTNARLMRKPAPALAALKKEAADIRAKMPPDAYTGDEAGGTFDESFWGRMLDLIYTGHEDLAWQYFDWAWNPKKAGKEIFKKDFEKQLAGSKFYQMFLTGK